MATWAMLNAQWSVECHEAVEAIKANDYASAKRALDAMRHLTRRMEHLELAEALLEDDLN